MTSPSRQPPSPKAIMIQPSSPRFPSSATHRKIGIAVDLSDESAYAVKWAVQNYLRSSTDSVILLHVRPTSVLYGADWGTPPTEENKEKMETDFDNFTIAKANELAKPLADANVHFKIHIVKDHDMKERLCLEVERLGLSAVIMGSRGFGASGARKTGKGRLGSVSDYCVHHCVCPVVVVRFPDAEEEGEEENVVVIKESPVEEEEEENVDLDPDTEKAS